MPILRLIALVLAAWLPFGAACGSVTIDSSTELCVTDSKRCTADDTQVQQCGEDGTWLFLQECAFNEICDAGACVDAPNGGGGGGNPGTGSVLGGCGKPFYADQQPYSALDQNTSDVGSLSCGDMGGGAGEHVYFVDTKTGADIIAQVTSDFDAVLYATIPGGCEDAQPACAAGKCLAMAGCEDMRVDEAAAGGEETLRITVPADPGGVFIVVDGSAAGETGLYSLDIRRDE